jgi:hypothetical protein
MFLNSDTSRLAILLNSLFLGLKIRILDSTEQLAKIDETKGGGLQMPFSTEILMRNWMGQAAASTDSMAAMETKPNSTR